MNRAYTFLLFAALCATSVLGQPLGRNAETDDSYGLLDYTYDASGNRTSFAADGVTQTYDIRYSNNWLLEAGAVTNSYDDNGNMVDRGGDVFTYDSFNRLVGASVGSNTALYTYNHLAQRVTKTLNGHTRLLLYDQAGNLITEVDAATGTVLAEYIWLDGTPLAFVQSCQTYHVHVDHLGTPKALTSGTGQVVWKAKHSPFGKATITSQGPTFNLRFPGQYYDAETGLHYNWRRYYDPNTGRYITSDPIGLAGGINTYAYALSNPVIYTDPTGLWVPQVIGAIVNMGFEGYRQYQAGSFDASRLLVAGATGALGGFGKTLMRAVTFGASSGAIANTYSQITTSSTSCAQSKPNRIDLYQIGRSATLGAFGGAIGFGGGVMGKNILRPKDIIGMDVKKRVRFNYESHGSAIGAAGGTTIGNQ